MSHCAACTTKTNCTIHGCARFGGFQQNRDWRTSSRCAADSPQCVGVLVADQQVSLKDTKGPDGTRVTFARGAFAQFVEGLRG